MPELCKWKYPLIFIFFFAVTVSSSYALDSCQSEITTDDLPCILFYPYNQSETACENISITFYKNKTLIYQNNLSVANSVLCNATFNQTEPQTYLYELSTGDGGHIKVTKGNKMINLFYTLFGLIIFFIILGTYSQDFLPVSLSGILMMVAGVYMHINGYDGITNMMVQGLAIIFIMLGFYVFIVPIYTSTDLQYY